MLIDPADGNEDDADGERIRPAQAVCRKPQPAVAARLVAGIRRPSRGGGLRPRNRPADHPAAAARSRSIRRIRIPSAPCAEWAICSCRRRIRRGLLPPAWGEPEPRTARPMNVTRGASRGVTMNSQHSSRLRRIALQFQRSFLRPAPGVSRRPGRDPEESGALRLPSRLRCRSLSTRSPPWLRAPGTAAAPSS